MNHQENLNKFISRGELKKRWKLNSFTALFMREKASDFPKVYIIPNGSQTIKLYLLSDILNYEKARGIK